MVRGDWGGEDYLDLLAVLDYVLERPEADASRTGIYGYSYGGYMTAWTIGQTDRFVAAVDLHDRKSYTVAYMIRAVTPG